MRTNAAIADEVSRLWRRHLHAEFPSRLSGQRVAGVDLGALDGEVADCVRSWRAGSTLDEDRREALAAALESLDAVLPRLLSRQEALYFGRVRLLAAAVLER